MKNVTRTFSMMSILFASLLTFTASANTVTPSVETSLTALVVKQGEQVVTNLKTELTQSIKNELQSFSIDVFKLSSNEENTAIAKTKNSNNNQTITSEE